MTNYELEQALASKQMEVEDLRKQLAGKETEVLHLAGKVLLVEQQLAEQAEAIDLQLHTNKRIKELEQQLTNHDAEILELKNNVTICVVRMGELRQQLAFATQERNGYREAQDLACEQRDEARQQVTRLMNLLEMIEHATAPSHDDGAFHENAYSLARSAKNQ